MYFVQMLIFHTNWIFFCKNLEFFVKKNTETVYTDGEKSMDSILNSVLQICRQLLKCHIKDEDIPECNSHNNPSFLRLLNKHTKLFSRPCQRNSWREPCGCAFRLNSPAIVYKTTRNVIPTFENINAVKARQ